MASRAVERTSLVEMNARRMREGSGRRRVILTVSPGAGYTFETNCLARQLAADFDIIYLKTIYGGEPGMDGMPAGEWCPVPPYPPLAAPSQLGSLAVSWSAMVATIKVLLRRRVDLVMVVATSHAVPVLLAARLLGRRTVFVESVTRVDRLSNTGRLVRWLHLASRFFVQWPGLQARTPGALLGTLL